MWLLLLMVLPEHIRNRRSVKVAAFLVVVGTLLFWWYNFPFQKVHQYIMESHKSKSILLWNAHPDQSELYFKQSCGSIRCEIITNRSERAMDSYDAIVVLFGDTFLPLDSSEFIDYQTARNNTNQRFVFFTQESPLSLGSVYNVSEWANIFNWTMTYRRDSDIPLLYGRIVPEESAMLSPEEVLHHIERARQSFRPRPLPNARKKKTSKNVIAWTVSDCNTTSRIETYVEELSRYIDIDMYGECGNLNFDGSFDVTDYKFYLSFENALCPDYVTGTFFEMMNQDIVPIVYGGAIYEQYAPIHSYIDARQFKPKELAAYLTLLDANETLYGEYFWWKDHYRVKSSVKGMMGNAFCHLCQELHRNFRSKSYPNLTHEWSENQCTTLDPLLIS
ncbi:alpha-(1,3)-fucosyltransferase C-like [Daphnia carinata]|uniref:alpha-(1,3)-fucosyltransferase C-like n=1 Tax=Daphnia carinata TaxID=120202 RepID=UPI00257E38A7|nr:alpha-(1,3)-fucosyltransferase C-like [Daphnia carinata]